MISTKAPPTPATGALTVAGEEIAFCRCVRIATCASHTERNPQLERLQARISELERGAADHARSAAALARCEERFHAVADYTYDLEFWIGPDGRPLWVNPAVERLTGYSVDECLAMADYPVPLIHEDDLERVSAAFRGALSGGSGNDLPFRLRRKDGRAAWVAVSWQPTFAADGTCLGYRSSIRDIGDRKRAEDSLVEERRLLTSIIAHIPCGVFWKDRQFRYGGCNEAFARSAGVARPADIVGKTDYELAWDKDQADYFRACDRQVIEGNLPLLNIEEVERQADGRQAILLTSKVPLSDSDGSVCGVLGIDTDISELKKVEEELRQARTELEVRVQERTAELSATNERLRREMDERERAQAALRASEERYRLVSELTSDFAYAFQVDAAGACHVEWVTDAFGRVTGRQPADLEGIGGWASIVCADDRPIAERRLQALLAGRSAENEFRIVTRDGQLRWLRDHARPIWGQSEGRVVRILGAARDITDRKQVEEEARRHQAALTQVARLSTMGEMAAQLAHELNQPLCTMIGNAQTAQRLLASPAPDIVELRAALGDIVTYGEHGAAVIRRLRDFLRHRQPQPVVLNVQRMIEEVASFVEADARQHAATARFDLADDLPAIRGDSIQLQQVLLNLVHNGLEAMESLPSSLRELVVSAHSPAPDAVVIAVGDSGSGLTPEIIERAFEPFFTTKPGGLGLGLAICRSVVEAHGGRLWAEPGVASGATFSVQLQTIQEVGP